jgi:hypothetical protein
MFGEYDIEDIKNIGMQQQSNMNFIINNKNKANLNMSIRKMLNER